MQLEDVKNRLKNCEKKLGSKFLNGQETIGLAINASEENNIESRENDEKKEKKSCNEPGNLMEVALKYIE